MCYFKKLILQESRHQQIIKVKVDRKKFREFLNDTFGMTDEIIMDRLFKYFNRIPTDDIDLEEWIVGFSVFLKGYINRMSLKGSKKVI